MQHAFAVAVEASGPDLPGAAQDVNGDWGVVGNQRAKYVQSGELGGFQSIDEGNARLSHKPKGPWVVGEDKARGGNMEQKWGCDRGKKKRESKKNHKKDKKQICPNWRAQETKNGWFVFPALGRRGKACWVLEKLGGIEIQPKQYPAVLEKDIHTVDDVHLGERKHIQLYVRTHER